ncbi:MAG TPA: response regulator [Polyangium sp.]|nr:response regulator [Polyangium sp.]
MNVLRVLHVEDNPGDADLVHEIFSESPRRIDISLVVDGESAVDYLLRRGEYVGIERPHLVLLDLNLPKLNGRDILSLIKQHEDLRKLPIVVFTSSDAEYDLMQSYALGANCYVTKPLDLKAFQHNVQAIRDFWFSVAQLP